MPRNEWNASSESFLKITDCTRSEQMIHLVIFDARHQFGQIQRLFLAHRELLGECCFPTLRARLRYHRSLKPLPGVGCSAGSSPDAIRPSSRFASVRAISGVQGDPRLLVVSLRTGRFFAERKWLAETAPVGWGKRIRTHKCRFQNWSLKCGLNSPSFRNVRRSETFPG